MIVLDTHVLVWWTSASTPLSKKAGLRLKKAQEASEPIAVSVISAWEIALLHQRGRLILSRPLDEWLATLRKIEGLAFFPVNVEIAVESTRLPGSFHPDPADRMIVALARHLDAPLLSADEKILAYPHVKTVW